MGRLVIWLRAITALAIPGCNKPEVSMVIWPVLRMALFAALGWLLMLSGAANGQASGGAAGPTGTAGEAAAAKADSKAPKRCPQGAARGLERNAGRTQCAS
jgi:hypothetical protein